MAKKSESKMAKKSESVITNAMAVKRVVAKVKAKVKKAITAKPKGGFSLKEMAAAPFSEAVKISRDLFALQVRATEGSPDPKSDMAHAIGLFLASGAKFTKLSIEEFVSIAAEIAKRAAKVK